jgi:hypothetical protein
MQKHTSICLVSLAAILFLVCSPSTVRAAQNAHPLQAYLGVFSASSSDARTLANTEFLIGGSYDFNHPKTTSTPYLSGYIGYAGGSNAGNSQGNFWVGAQVRTPQQIYVGAGTGYYDSWGTVNLGGGTSFNSSQGGIGGTVFVGGDFGPAGRPGPGLRAGYDFMPSFSGINPSGWELSVTYRF